MDRMIYLSMAGAKAARGASSSIWALAEALCDRVSDDHATNMDDVWGAHLAGQALAETALLNRVSKRNQTKLKRIKRRLVQIIEGDQLPAVERALSGNALAKLGDDRFWYGSAAAEWHDRDWLDRHRPATVYLTELTQTHTTLFDLSRFGLYATESMRLEKGYLHWKADILDEFNPMETSLERFVKLDKPDFVGKAALIKELERGPRRRLASLAIDCDTAPAHAGDPVWADDRQVGVVTSGGYGHRVGENIAYAFVEPGQAEIGAQLSVTIVGQSFNAKVVERCLFDPNNALVRS